MLFGNFQLLLPALAWHLAVATAAFHHKDGHASIVVGRTLYTVGGVVTTADNSSSGNITYTQTSDTYLHAIDLTKSFSTDNNVTRDQLTQGDSLQSGGLWLDGNSSRHSFLAYDGGVSLTVSPSTTVPPNQLVKYTINGNSTNITQASTSGNFSSLVRVQDAAFASGNGLGFALGGVQNSATIQNLTDQVQLQNVPGLVIFNISSGGWYNATGGGKYANGSSSAAAIFLPGYGPAGLFVPLGGLSSSTSQDISFETIDVYEPTSRVWRSQSTTGDKPSARHSACVVGAHENNNTYEIFLYGGIETSDSDEAKVANGDIYILTLPAFHWFRVTTSELGRYRHTCNVAGKRQMIVVGGVVEEINGTDSTDQTSQRGASDPWPQGLGVFDLTALQWKSQFDSNASNYNTPSIVKKFNAVNSTTTHFDDQVLKSWFATLRDDDADPSASTSASPARIDAGVIAGAVIGLLIIGTAFVTVFAWLIILYLQERKKTSYAAVYPSLGLAQHPHKDVSRDDVVELLPRNKP